MLILSAECLYDFFTEEILLKNKVKMQIYIIYNTHYTPLYKFSSATLSDSINPTNLLVHF